MSAPSPSPSQFGAIEIAPPTPLAFPGKPPVVPRRGKDLPDILITGSFATSTSQGESYWHSCSDSSPTGGLPVTADGANVDEEGKETPPGRADATFSLASTQAHTQPLDDTTSLSAAGDEEADAEEEEDEGGRSDAIANHEDSFYASLIMAQQLWGQRDTTARIGSRGSVAPSTAYTATDRSDSGNVGHLSSRSRPSPALSAATGTSPSSPNTPQVAPRTLHDLLAWRQELLETRIRDHTAAQQHNTQANLHTNWSFASGRSVNTNFEQLPSSARLAPQLLSPLSLSQEPRQPSFTFSDARSPASQREEGEDLRTVPTQHETRLPLVLGVRSTDGYSHPSAHYTVPSAAAALPHFRPSPILQPQMTPTSTGSSAVRTRRTTPHAAGFATAAGDGAVARMRSEQDYRLMVDDEFHQPFLTRMVVTALLFLLLFVIFDSPFLPGGSTGIFF